MRLYLEERIGVDRLRCHQFVFAAAIGHQLTQPNGMIVIVYAGMVLLAVGLVTLGIGLIREPRTTPYS